MSVVRCLLRALTSVALSSVLLGASWLIAPQLSGAAGTVRFGPHDVHSAFYVAKSENKNEVHYGVHVDAACHPQGSEPVFAYWRRLKKGVRVDEPLEGAGIRLYGASSKQAVTVTPTGGRVAMHVRALERLPIDIQVDKSKDVCVAIAHVVLKREKARLSHAFLQLGMFGLSVKYIDVWGARESDGKKVTEQFR